MCMLIYLHDVQVKSGYQHNWQDQGPQDQGTCQNCKNLISVHMTYILFDFRG